MSNEILGDLFSKNHQSEVIHRYYSNGAMEVYFDGVLGYVVYDTGDKVHFELVDGELEVVAYFTHDGLSWGYSTING
jgi:hypothetical protein